MPDRAASGREVGRERVGGTSSPCRSTRSEDLGPRPHATYSCGVSSLARSEIYTTEREHENSQRERGGGGMERWMATIQCMYGEVTCTDTLVSESKVCHSSELTQTGAATAHH